VVGGKQMKKNKNKVSDKSSRLFMVTNYIFLTLIAVIMFYPMYYVFIVSISSSKYINTNSVYLVPRGITFKAYEIVVHTKRIWRSYGNTLLYTGLGTVINLVLTAMCAYPLSRNDFYGNKFFTIFVTVTMFISGGTIPLYLTVMKLKMINTMWAIVLPPAISTYNMIVMRTSFQAIPASLAESAYLDGANDIQILKNIVLPLSKPIMATMTLFYAVSHWNSYFPAMLYLNDSAKYPLQMILREIVVQGSMSDQGIEVSAETVIAGTNYKYAVIIFSVVPILMVYPLLQKYFTKGVMVGAVKG